MSGARGAGAAVAGRAMTRILLEGASVCVQSPARRLIPDHTIGRCAASAVRGGASQPR